MTPSQVGRYFADPHKMTDDDLWAELDSLESSGYTHGQRWREITREMDERGL